jgi:hypothetical protein
MSQVQDFSDIDPCDWPEPSEVVTDRDALIMAKLILDGKPRSYVDGARRLAQYVLSLNIQVSDIEALLDREKQAATHDTMPPSV